jgi:hypothetical protein
VRYLPWLVALLPLGMACEDKITGQQPVGGTIDSDASIQRYLRRAYLDLTGTPPADADLTSLTQQLHDQSNTAVARGTLVDTLVAKPEYAKVWTQELETAIFGGNDLDQQYALICGIVRGDAACASCTATDSCTCSCPEITPLLAERTQLATTATDFGNTTTTSELERRYAMAEGYYVLAGTPEVRTTDLFTDFLARTAESDEIENGRAMIVGSLIAGSPAGLMFHKEGASYTDLLDIIFNSEVYRESMVRRVFLRYLAREPSNDELAHFVPTLDAMKPDSRSVVRAVVSSREYFDQ